MAVAVACRALSSLIPTKFLMNHLRCSQLKYLIYLHHKMVRPTTTTTTNVKLDIWRSLEELILDLFLHKEMRINITHDKYIKHLNNSHRVKSFRNITISLFTRNHRFYDTISASFNTSQCIYIILTLLLPNNIK